MHFSRSWGLVWRASFLWCRCWHVLWYNLNMSVAQRKVTVHLPDELLSKAQEQTGEGITETIRIGLLLVAAKQAYEGVRDLRGKVKFSLNLKKLREDR